MAAKGQKQKSHIFRFLILGVLLIGLLSGYVLVKQTQLISQQAAVASASLSFDLGSITVRPQDQFNVSFSLTTGNNSLVGADILVRFDPNLLTLISLTKPSHSIFRTFAPVTSAGLFDTQRVVNCANAGGTNCPSGIGVVEFGMVAFDWSTNSLTGFFGPNAIMSPVSVLTFRANALGTDTLRFIYTSAGATRDSNAVIVGPEDVLLQPTSSLVVNISDQITPTLSGGGLGGSPTPTQAFGGGPLQAPLPPPSAPQLTDLEAVFGNAVTAVLALIGIVLFIMLVIGGLKYITSGGDPKKAEEAKQTLTYAIAGVILVASAYLILRLINQVTGADILNFSVNR